MADEALSSQRIRDQLSKILASRGFSNSPILSGFLSYIVEEYLAGNVSQIKEYSIALKVLSRRRDFNPQQDAIVRIHAGRLRRSLQEYYQDQGANDPIRIIVPKGSYVPEFTSLEKVPGPGILRSATPAFDRKVKVAVLPFSNTSPDPGAGSLADGLGDSISNELTRYAELGVISYYSCRSLFGNTPDIKVAGEMLGSDFILTGSVQCQGAQLRIMVQLARASSREQIWAETYDRINAYSEYFDIQREIAWQVVSQTAGHFGAISRSLSRTGNRWSGDLRNYNTLYWYYDFVSDTSWDIFHRAEIALTEALQLDPDYALGWAILGEVYIGGYFYGYRSTLTEQMLEKALECGRMAIKLDPLCQHGYQTLAFASLFLHEWDKCRKALIAWENIRPHSSGVQCAMGFMFICLGEYDKGHAMAMEAIELNPYYQWWVNAGICFHHFKNGDAAQAFTWAERMNKPDVPWWYLLMGSCKFELNERTEAEKYFLELHERFPLLQEQLPAYARSFLRDEQLIDRILNAAQQAVMH